MFSWHWAKCFPHLFYLIFTITSDVGAFVLPILWVKKNSLREQEQLPQGQKIVGLGFS